jgi:hypothetical protein
MNLHEFKYCAFLLSRVKELYVEREAMSTILDSPTTARGTMGSDWRDAAKKLREDAVFQSSVEANFAPIFERMRSAMISDTALAQLTSADTRVRPSGAEVI